MLTDPTLWGAIALVVGFVGLSAGLAYTWRRKRDCPSCGRPLVPLGRQGKEPISTAIEGDALTYEVLVCPRCTNAVTNVRGAQHRYANCPECRQRTLETPCIRMPDTEDGRRRVEIHESCHLCGHVALREVADAVIGPAKRGQVIPFPANRRKKQGTDDR